MILLAIVSMTAAGLPLAIALVSRISVGFAQPSPTVPFEQDLSFALSCILFGVAGLVGLSTLSERPRRILTNGILQSVLTLLFVVRSAMLYFAHSAIAGAPLWFAAFACLATILSFFSFRRVQQGGLVPPRVTPAGLVWRGQEIPLSRITDVRSARTWNADLILAGLFVFPVFEQLLNPIFSSFLPSPFQTRGITDLHILQTLLAQFSFLVGLIMLGAGACGRRGARVTFGDGTGVAFSRSLIEPDAFVHELNQRRSAGAASTN